MKKQINSFRYAFNGLRCAFKSEAHLRFHCCIAILVILCGFLFHISFTEWIACILCIGSVITAELINTAIESTIDLYTQEQHPLAKKAKDVAAGAVLACAITAAIIGLMIFFPKALDLILSLFTE